MSEREKGGIWVTAQRLSTEFRNRITPEQEYLLGLGICAGCAAVLADSDLVPQQLVDLYRYLSKNIPSYNLYYAFSGFSIGLGIALDGAVRIANERLPFIKAVVKMYADDLMGE